MPTVAGSVPDLRTIERKRVLEAARRYLAEQPITITAYRAARSAGGEHDYFSEGDYWWPDPKNPDGPYIQRDGESNPDNFNQHRHALIRLSLHVPALAAAWVLTRDARYSRHAAAHLRAWFITPATRMNPNLQYAQAIRGITTGRGIGIIDTLHLVEVARAASRLEKAPGLAPGERDAVKNWFAEYLNWMNSSKNGQEEREAKNNHGTCWTLQAAEFARFTGDSLITQQCRERMKNVILPNQIAADGSFPQELRRTKPYSYSLFNLDAMATACHVLSTPADSLWSFQTAGGRGIEGAMAFMFPYIRDKRSWPHKPDVQYWDQWPVRQPALLFAGVALGKPEYIALWRALNPDPAEEEAVRNYPIRQPLLWF
ncbi:MAG TPA: alginate lyase family protein [Terriglobales bacterium]|nr:alginate lyase family protein [Terriglobales bacterium]